MMKMRVGSGQHKSKEAGTVKKIWKRKIFWLAVGLLMVIGATHIQGAMAYFTTYVAAAGGYPITLGSKVTIKEDVEDMKKHIQLINTGQEDCYVRVKVFYSNEIKVGYVSAMDEQNQPYWKLEEDEYWYYKEILPIGAETPELVVTMEVPKELKDSFNVVVVQECTSVLYREDGTPYADWNKKIDTKTDIGTIVDEEECRE